MPEIPQQAFHEAGEEPYPRKIDDEPTSQKATQEMQEKPLLSTVENHPPGFTQLRASAYDIFWVISFRIVTIFILVGCLTLGAKKQVFGLRDTNVNVSIVSKVFDLPVDAQLAVFGLVNKLLDYLVQDALAHICGITLTTWMALTKIGAHTMDFQMTDELTMPWITVLNFIERFRLLGWQGVGALGLLRYISSFATSIMVLLLGAGVNTIAIPKERWTGGTDVWTDRYQINSLEWGGVDNTAWNMDFSFEGMQNRSYSIIASQIWLVTSGLWMASNKDGFSDGWVEVYQDKNGAWNKTSNSRIDAKRVTGIRLNGTTVSSLSIHGNAVYDLWISQTEHGSTNAKNSFGCAGAFNLTLPIGMVTCVENTTGTNAETVTVAGPNPQSPAAITIMFGGSTTRSFPGATCTFTLRQGQYRVHSWIIDQGQPDISIDAYGADRYINITFYESQATQNRNIMVQIADVFRATIPIMDHLSPNGLVQHVLSVSDNLLRIGRSSPNGTAGLAMVVAGMLQHVVTMAEWESVKASPGSDLVRSTGVRYQVYGSGPRLSWEWAIAAVLVIAILMLVYDIFLTLRERINVGLWLSLSGMMITANYADKMPSINDGSESETVQRTSYFIRKLDSGNSKLTDDPNSGTILSRYDGFGEDPGRDQTQRW